MTAHIIDGKALAAHIRTDVTHRVAALKAQGITPGLAVILVGDNPASQVYVRNKVKACQDCGMHSVLEKHDASMTQDALLARVQALNADASIHGILVQLPLPAHIDAQRVIETISPAKDVDGFHIASAGALMTGMPGFWPCTPYGCMKMLEHIGYPRTAFDPETLGCLRGTFVGVGGNVLALAHKLGSLIHSWLLATQSATTEQQANHHTESYQHDHQDDGHHGGLYRPAHGAPQQTFQQGR